MGRLSPITPWTIAFSHRGGLALDDRVAGVPDKFAVNAKRIAHLDIDRSEINKVKSVQWSHTGLLPEACGR